MATGSDVITPNRQLEPDQLHSVEGMRPNAITYLRAGPADSAWLTHVLAALAATGRLFVLRARPCRWLPACDRVRMPPRMISGLNRFSSAPVAGKGHAVGGSARKLLMMPAPRPSLR